MFGTAVCQHQRPLDICSQSPAFCGITIPNTAVDSGSKPPVANGTGTCVSYGNHRSQCGLMDRTRFYMICTTPECSSCNRKWLIQFLDGSLFTSCLIAGGSVCLPDN